MLKIPITLDELKFIDNYSFFDNKLFQTHPIQFLTLAGSISYGTNNENSDIDIRGIFIETPDELLSLQKRQTHFIDPITDTILYSLQEFITLLCSCNPNIIELLGTNKEHIIYETELMKSLRENTHLFLSKHAYLTFAGYANAQLRRLENALAHDEYDAYDKEQHILKTVKYELSRTENDFKLLNDKNEYHLYIDNNENNEPEIFADLKLSHISLRKLAARTNQLHATIKNFDKLNHRNRKKDTNHLNKHAMHLIRLFYTGIDILKNGIIRTYRPPEELALLKDIRNGFLPYDTIFKLTNELEQEIQKAAETSKLPDEPDMNKINKWLKDTYIQLFFS